MSTTTTVGPETIEKELATRLSGVAVAANGSKDLQTPTGTDQNSTPVPHPSGNDLNKQLDQRLDMYNKVMEKLLDIGGQEVELYKEAVEHNEAALKYGHEKEKSKSQAMECIQIAKAIAEMVTTLEEQANEHRKAIKKLNRELMVMEVIGSEDNVAVVD